MVHKARLTGGLYLELRLETLRIIGYNYRLEMKKNVNFWKELKKPIIGLSPMDGVTDAAMRFICAKYGRPAVSITEFVSAEGIAAKAIRLMRDFRYDEIERPVVAQLFGKDPKAFYKATKKVIELGFDGVDINMGCPSKNVADRGAGAGLIANRELAAEIIASVKKAISESDRKIPLSVKTRIGTVGPDKSWWEFLAGQDLAAVTMHGRSFKQLYQGMADWEVLAEAASVIKSKSTVLLGNGDVANIKDATEKCKKYKVDGVLIGRGAQGNPWIFNGKEVGKKEKLEMALAHAKKYEEIFPGEMFLNMRKHLAWYSRGFDNAGELRQKLVLTNSADEVSEIIKGEI